MKPSTPRPAIRVGRPAHFLALGFGSGLVPWAPGTWGTLAAVPVYWLLATLSLPLYLGVVVLFFAAGVYFCEVTSRDAGVHDHPAIVWDEIVGYLITMAAVPVNWYWPLLGFLLFRFFDILKPWPIRYLDRYVSGGFGIMIDDALAGVFAWAVLQALLLL